MRSILNLPTLRVCVFSIVIISSGYCSAGALGSLGVVILGLVYGGAQAQMNTTAVNSTPTIAPSSTNSTNANLNSIGMPTQVPNNTARNFVANPYFLLGVTGTALVLADKTSIGGGVNSAIEGAGYAIMATGRAVKGAGTTLYEMVAEKSEG